jgi:hypothetical protein
MPRCKWVKLPDGNTAILTGNFPRPKDCACGKPSTRLCDWIIGRGRTCDAPLCDACTSSPAKDKDLCKRHAQLWAKDPRSANKKATP